MCKFELFVGVIIALLHVQFASRELSIDQKIREGNRKQEKEDERDGLETVELDMVVKKGKRPRIFQRHRGNNRNAAKDLWKKSEIPYRFGDGIDDNAKRLIREAMDEWEAYSCLKFFEDDNDNNNTNKIVFIYNQRGGGCATFYVGMKKWSEPQEIHFGKGCLYLDIILHEIGHALGFYHEHNRADRDKYIKVRRKNIEPGFRGQFRKLKKSDYKDFDKPYDYESIMHYGQYFYSRNESQKVITMKTLDPDFQDVIGKAKHLSFLDYTILNKMYKCSDEFECGDVKCPVGGFLGKHCKCYCKGKDDDQTIMLCFKEGSDVIIDMMLKGQRGLICDDNWDDNDATVACRMMGFEFGKAARFKYNSKVSESLPILLDDVKCSGTESTLSECNHNGWGNHDCEHSEVAAMKCFSYIVSKQIDVFSNYDCGKIPLKGFKRRKPERRIVGGVEAVKGMNPWQVRIRRRIQGRWQHWCGGTIISSHWILSAAHCFETHSGTKMKYEDFKVVLGDHDWTKDDGHEQEFNIEYLVKHWQYKETDVTKNDIALLKIDRDTGADFNNYVQPACVPGEYDSFDYGMKCEASGWGRLSEKDYSIPNKLRSVEVPIIEDRACENFYKHHTIDTQRVFCAGDVNRGIDTCKGDSGGPLVCGIKKRYTVFGITSWGYDCGQPDAPGVYTKVSSFVSWMKEQIALHDSVERYLGQSCSDDSHCSLVINGECRNSKCLCKSGYYQSGSGPLGSCTKRYLDQGCNDDSQCSQVTNGECRNSKCLCKNGYYQTGTGSTGTCSNHGHSAAQIRLVNGTRPDGSNGRLEVLYNGKWGTVCDNILNRFDGHAATVVCRMLGYTGNLFVARKSTHYGAGTGQIWLQDITCFGNEKSLSSCQTSPWGQHFCDHDKDVGVDCDPNQDAELTLRLVNGKNGNEGRVEVQHGVNGLWCTICDDGWDYKAALIVCQQITGRYENSITAVPLTEAFFGEGQGKVWLDDIKCTGFEAGLGACIHSPWGQSNCQHNEDAGVICLPKSVASAARYRLVNGTSDNNGRVEVNLAGYWGTVCDDHFDAKAASVICKILHLSYQNALPVGAGLYGFGTGIIWLDDVSCLGSETTLMQCETGAPGATDCTHRDDVGVICTDTAARYRLVNGTSDNNGRVEVNFGGEWGTFCADFDADAARVICKSLHLPFQHAHPVGGGFYGSGTGRIWLDDVTCYGHEDSLMQCQTGLPGATSCTHEEDIRVFCTDTAIQYRLVNGTSGNNGRVEVNFAGEWGTVCDDNFDADAARVICKSLHLPYENARPVGEGLYGFGTGRIWLDDFRCFGNEASLMQCNTRLIGTTSCTHKEDTGVICTDKAQYRLVNGTSGNIGRVEVNFGGEWGTVCDDHFDTTAARVICKTLHLPYQNAHLAGAGLYGFGTGTIWLDDVTCFGHETTLMQCATSALGSTDCTHKDDVGVICTDNDCVVPNEIDERLSVTDTNRVSLSGGSLVENGDFVYLNCSTADERKYEPFNRRFSCLNRLWIEAERDDPNWSFGNNGDFPVCREVLCDNSCLLNGGTCVGPGVCSCPAGRFGPNCEQEGGCIVPKNAAKYRSGRIFYNVGETLTTFECDPGFIVSSRNGMTCRNDKTWSDIVTCENAVYYLIKAKTGKPPFSGTSANVYITLHGQTGKTDKIFLAGSFGYDDLDETRIQAIDIRPIISIVIGQDGKGFGSAWYMEYVSIHVEGKEYIFEYNDWVTMKKDVTLLRQGLDQQTCIDSFDDGNKWWPDWNKTGTQSMKDLAGEKKLSLRECKQACIKQTTIQCVSVYYHSGFGHCWGLAVTQKPYFTEKLGSSYSPVYLRTCKQFE